MIKEVKGNLLIYPGIEIVAHQCNCLGVWGGGIAKQIKSLYPKMFKDYYNYCKLPSDAHSILGTVQFLHSDDGKQIYANMFGEYSFCESVAPYKEGEKPRHTDYDALKECLHWLHMFAILNRKKTIGIPFKLGCGLAGGNWEEVVYPMVKEEFENDKDITLYIVNFID